MEEAEINSDNGQIRSTIAQMLLAAITHKFLTSAETNSFNGLRADLLLKIEADPLEIKSQLKHLTREQRITCVFVATQINMHIKRFPDLSVEDQLDYLDAESLEETCLYPTAATIQSSFDVSSWSDRPYSQELLIAEPQLSFRAFDLGALERYTSDPRYIVHFADYMGRMSIGDMSFENERYPERDKVSLQTFGLGFSSERAPYVVVFLRYLANLSPEHQQYWKSFETDEAVMMCRQYRQSAIEGTFWKNRSIRYAIVTEIELINSPSTAVWDAPIFRTTPKEDIPIGLTFFLRPTSENYHRFVMAMDKLLSENINAKFFEGKLPLEIEKARKDGKVIITRKSTIALLEEWLLAQIEWEDNKKASELIIGPFRRVRKERQKPAHEFTIDRFSVDYRQKRERLLWEVFNSLSNIRRALTSHPNAQSINVPSWLDEDEIDVF